MGKAKPLALVRGRYLRFGLGEDLGEDLAHLLSLVARQELDAQVTWRGDWHRFPEAAGLMLARQLNGKAVLDIPSATVPLS